MRLKATEASCIAITLWCKGAPWPSRTDLVKAAASFCLSISGEATCDNTPAKSVGAEAALSAAWSADALKGVATDAEGLNSDIHASAVYRAHLCNVVARKAVAAAG